MGRNKPSGKKTRLTREHRRTRWAPFWLLPRIYGMNRGRKVHPSRINSAKRRWRRDKIQD